MRENGSWKQEKRKRQTRERHNMETGMVRSAMEERRKKCAKIDRIMKVRCRRSKSEPQTERAQSHRTELALLAARMGLPRAPPPAAPRADACAVATTITTTNNERRKQKCDESQNSK